MRFVRRFLIWVLLGCLCTLCSHSIAQSYPDVAIEVQATGASLNQDGSLRLSQGNALAALKLWQEASRRYGQEHNPEGQAGATLNQSLAMAQLGLYPRACETIVGVLNLNRAVCLYSEDTLEVQDLNLQTLLEPIADREIDLIGLRLLGDVLRSIGKLESSLLILEEGQKRADAGLLLEESANIRLSLGVTRRILVSQAMQNFLRSDEPKLRQADIRALRSFAIAAMKDYDTVAAAGFAPLALKAKLNQLSLQVELNHWFQTKVPWLEEEIVLINSAMGPSSQKAAESLIDPYYISRNSVGMDAVYNRLNLVQTLVKNQASPRPLVWSDSLVDLVPQWINESVQKAIDLEHSRSLSFALGTQAQWLNLKKPTDAQIESLYQQALSLSQSVQAHDLSYQWQRLLGERYKSQGKLKQAIQYYQLALENVSQVRANLSGVNPEIQFSFYERESPLYRDLMDLLLREPQPQLLEVVKVNELKQIAELENFLQCGRRLSSVSLQDLRSRIDNPNIIHIIELNASFEVIVQSSDGALFRYSADLKQVQDQSRYLKSNLQSDQLFRTDPELFLPYAKALYVLLLKNAIETHHFAENSNLVFVLDSALQNIPMALLHDGQKFLLEHYKISIALSSQVQEPKSFKLKPAKALVAGLSQASPSFKDPSAQEGLTALPEVEAEMDGVARYTGTTTRLLNEGFTAQRLTTELQENDFSVVHLSTHGQFSSDPSQTLLLSWDKVIRALSFVELLKAPKNLGYEGIELLVLSACETAKGDNRSALGIAGVAAQSGARSTIASLWLVDSDSTVVLMNAFYRGLDQGLPKAEALRQAQLLLLGSSSFSHPVYWSAFILIGSWL